MSKHLNPLLAILLFSLIGMKTLIQPGLFTAHDIFHQVVRFYYYYQAISDGQFPPYWISQLANGFGYPLFLFSYHLPWLIGIPLLKLGLNIPATIKVLFIISYLASGFSMYFFVNSLLKNKLASLLSAILYLWLPYHFLTIFVSASIGIAFVFVFLPIMLLGIHLIKEEAKFGIPIFAIGVSGIILSHIMHLAFLLPLVLIFFLWEFQSSTKKLRFLQNTALGLILTIMLSSFYLIPAFSYNSATRVQQESGFYELYKRNFINFKQLIYSRWSYSPIVNNAKNGEVSFQLGIAQWLTIAALIILAIFRKLNSKYQSLGIYLTLALIINIFLMLDQSKFIWQFFIKFITIDFPFRLILPAAFITSVLAGLVYLNLGRLKILFFIFLTFAALYTNRNHINVNQYTNLQIKDYLEIETEITTNTFNEYLPKQADPKLLGKPWNEARGKYLKVSNLKRTTNVVSFNIEATQSAVISLGQFAFPGQTLYLNNQQISPEIDQEGRISLTVKEGSHNISINYQPTLLMQTARYLTLIGILIILFIFAKEIFKKKSYS